MCTLRKESSVDDVICMIPSALVGSVRSGLNILVLYRGLMEKKGGGLPYNLPRIQVFQCHFVTKLILIQQIHHVGFVVSQRLYSVKHID